MQNISNGDYLSGGEHAVDTGGQVLGEELLQALAQVGQVAAKYSAVKIRQYFADARIVKN